MGLDIFMRGGIVSCHHGASYDFPAHCETPSNDIPSPRKAALKASLCGWEDGHGAFSLSVLSLPIYLCPIPSSLSDVSYFWTRQWPSLCLSVCGGKRKLKKAEKYEKAVGRKNSRGSCWKSL